MIDAKINPSFLSAALNTETGSPGRISWNNNVQAEGQQR
jgi:predicted secreted protein